LGATDMEVKTLIREPSGFEKKILITITV